MIGLSESYAECKNLNNKLWDVYAVPLTRFNDELYVNPTFRLVNASSSEKFGISKRYVFPGTLRYYYCFTFSLPASECADYKVLSKVFYREFDKFRCEHPKSFNIIPNSVSEPSQEWIKID